VQVPDDERGDFGASQPDLQTDRQNRPVPQPFNGIVSGMIKDFPGVRRRKRQRRPFLAVNPDVSQVV
jgi:hypothetical protein